MSSHLPPCSECGRPTRNASHMGLCETCYLAEFVHAASAPDSPRWMREEARARSNVDHLARLGRWA